MAKRYHWGHALTAIGLVGALAACFDRDCRARKSVVSARRSIRRRSASRPARRPRSPPTTSPTALSLGRSARSSIARSDAGFRALLGNIYLARAASPRPKRAYRDSLTLDRATEPQVVLKLCAGPDRPGQDRRRRWPCSSRGAVAARSGRSRPGAGARRPRRAMRSPCSSPPRARAAPTPAPARISRWLMRSAATGTRRAPSPRRIFAADQVDARMPAVAGARQARPGRAPGRRLHRRPARSPAIPASRRASRFGQADAGRRRPPASRAAAPAPAAAARRSPPPRPVEPAPQVAEAAPPVDAAAPRRGAGRQSPRRRSPTRRAVASPRRRRRARSPSARRARRCRRPRRA